MQRGGVRSVGSEVSGGQDAVGTYLQDCGQGRWDGVEEGAGRGVSCRLAGGCWVSGAGGGKKAMRVGPEWRAKTFLGFSVWSWLPLSRACGGGPAGRQLLADGQGVGIADDDQLVSKSRLRTGKVVPTFPEDALGACSGASGRIRGRI